MKLTFNIDCTPEEARAFLGLPDVGPMQARLMTELEHQLRAGMTAMQPDSLMKAWLPAGVQNMEQAQQLFWSNLQQTMTGLAATTTSAMASFSEKLKP